MAATKKERELRREAVRRILMDDKTELRDQGSLVELLEALGISATQASVSRDLRELGAVWVDGHYKIPTWEDEEGNPL